MTSQNGPPTLDTTLIQYFQQVYRPRRLLNGAPATIHHHVQYITRLSEFLDRPAELRDLNDDTVSAFLAKYAVGRSMHSVDSAQNCLLALWRHVAGRGLLIAPDLARVKVPREIPEAWTLDEMQRLLVAARAFLPSHHCRSRALYCGVPAGLWWRGFILLLYDTGFRRGAALNLTWADVDLSAENVIARAEFQKTDRDEVRAISYETAAALQAIRLPKRELIFPFLGDLTATFSNHFNRVLALAGLSAGRRDKAQKIRRTSATQVARIAGMAAAAEHLGHSSIRLTQRNYVDSRQLPPPSYARKLPRPEGRPQ